MNLTQALIFSYVLVISFINQFTIAIEQWDLTNYDMKQFYYNQILEQYINYYNYLNQQDIVLNNENSYYSNNNNHTNHKSQRTTNVVPINIIEVENRSLNEEQTIAKPIFLRRNKILLPRPPNTKPRKPLKSKLRSLFNKAQNKNNIFK